MVYGIGFRFRGKAPDKRIVVDIAQLLDFNLARKGHRPLTRPAGNLTQCKNQMVLESQVPHKIVNV